MFPGALLRPGADAVSSSGRSSGPEEGRMDVAPADLPGYRKRALAALLCFWLLVSFLAIRAALGSDWAPFGQLPTGEQVARARADAEVAAVLSVVPALGGLVLARRWRSAGWTATFL